MKVEVTSSSVSKKGTIWLQVKIIKDSTYIAAPEIGDTMECEIIGKAEEKKDVTE